MIKEEVIRKIFNFTLIRLEFDKLTEEQINNINLEEPTLVRYFDKYCYYEDIELFDYNYCYRHQVVEEFFWRYKATGIRIGYIYKNYSRPKPLFKQLLRELHFDPERTTLEELTFYLLLEFKVGEDRFWEEKSKVFKRLARREQNKAWRRLNRGLSIEDINKEIKIKFSDILKAKVLVSFN